MKKINKKNSAADSAAECSREAMAEQLFKAANGYGTGKETYVYKIPSEIFVYDDDAINAYIKNSLGEYAENIAYTLSVVANYNNMVVVSNIRFTDEV